MSKYTTEVRYICEFEAGKTESEGYSTIDEILTSAAPNIFNFSFPIFDEQYRLVLEKKILRHYYTREISEETVGLWKLRLEDKLNLIMPYYNKLYQSELLSFNPLYDVDLTREYDKDNDGVETGTSTSEDEINGTANRTRTETAEREDDKTITNQGTSGNTNTINRTDNTTYQDSKNGSNNNTQWDLYSDTPQGGIIGITGDNDPVNTHYYLTNARKITNNGSNTEADSGTGSVVQTGTVTDSGSVSSTTNETGTINNDVSETIADENTNTKSSSSSTTNNITNTEQYIEHVTGKTGGISFSKMLKEFRETFLNIDMMIIDDLSTLFFGLW